VIILASEVAGALDGSVVFTSWFVKNDTNPFDNTFERIVRNIQAKNKI